MRVAHAAARMVTPVKARDDLVRLGSGYGGWWVPAGLIGAGTVVYSAGVGEDVTFDLALIERFGCHVWAMDPTPRVIGFAASVAEPRFHFEPVGVWPQDTELRFYAPADPAHVSHSVLNVQRTSEFFTAPCLSLESLMARFGHERIDLLKLDVEGAEGPLLDAMLAGPLRPGVLCVEFDRPEPPWTPPGRLRRLEGAGYLVRQVEGRNYTLTRD